MSSQSPAPPDDPEEEPSYEVGYGKPPQATRFQPGKSGNPKGRPKGSRKAPPADTAVEKLKALVLQEAYRPIKIKDGETLVEMPTIQAAAAQRHPQCGEGKPAGAAPAPRQRRRNRGRTTPRAPEALRGGGGLQGGSREGDGDGGGTAFAGACAGAASRPPHHRPDHRVGETARSVHARGKGGMGRAHRHEGHTSGSSSPNWRRSGGPHPAAAI